MERAALSWEKFVQWAFLSLLTASTTVACWFLMDVRASLKEMSLSIVELNRNMAVVITTSQYQQRAIDSLTSRIERIEEDARKGRPISRPY